MAFVLVLLFMLGNVAHAKHVKEAIQYRITESELNKVVSSLLSTSSDDVDITPSNQTLILNDLEYELQVLLHEFSGEEVHLKIPVDGRVDAVVRFSSVHLEGKVRVNGPSDDDVYDNEAFGVTLTNVTLVSKYFLGQNVFREDLTTLNFDFTNCSADIKEILTSVESDQSIISQITEDNQRKLFQNALCHSYEMQLNLGFAAFGVSFEIVQRPFLITTVTCGLEIRNKRFLITQEVETTNTHDEPLPACSAANIFQLSSMDATSQPFEIVLNMDSFNSLLKDLKKKLEIGDKKMSVGDIIPNLKDVLELDTEGNYMSILFPRVKDTYPDAVGRMVVLDADINIKVTDGSLQLNFDITSNMLITLNCDKNRTYSAFNFTMNLFFPAQIGFDNEYLTLKVIGFGGKFTVHNSTVGHIFDRVQRGILYALPSYTKSTFDELNDHLKKGILLNGFLPEGVFLKVKSVSLKKDCVVVGGGLTLVNPPSSLEEKVQDNVGWTICYLG